MNEYIQLLQSRKELLVKLKQKSLKRLGNLKYKGQPRYHIRVYSDKDQIYIRVPGNNEEQYLKSSKRQVAADIASYDYLKGIVKRIDAELKHVNWLLKTGAKQLPEDYYESLSKGRRKLIDPIWHTDEQFVNSWLSKPYIGKGFEEEDSEFYTDKNERVRSKSEILIANALEKHNVPYKYECPIVLKGMGKIHPDFTALNVKRRKIYYWEHLGKLDDPDYARKNVFRINTYEKNGIFHGENLITTWETSTLPLDVKLVDELINHYLLE